MFESANEFNNMTGESSDLFFVGIKRKHMLRLIKLELDKELNKDGILQASSAMFSGAELCSYRVTNLVMFC